MREAIQSLSQVTYVELHDALCHDESDARRPHSQFTMAHRTRANCFIYGTALIDTVAYQKLYFLAQKPTLHMFCSPCTHFIVQAEDMDREVENPALRELAERKDS